MNILWVDDDYSMWSPLARIMKKRLQTEVDIAISVETAIKKIGLKDYDLIITDLVLPQVDSHGSIEPLLGLDLVARIRGGFLGEHAKNSPILIFSIMMNFENVPLEGFSRIKMLSKLEVLRGADGFFSVIGELLDAKPQ